ncbi:dioxygenase [Desulfocarbo indianensis]|nr:dioxygenase [Desulfocarbo indianensis]
MLRHPVVADQFYPGDPGALRYMMDGFLKNRPAQPQKALAAVSPHAGYVYSGKVAGQVLGRLEIPGRVVVLGPNHRGMGADVAVMSQGHWLTPLGRVALDAELGSALKENCALVEEDSLAHQYEHSLEVQVPFLQALREDFMLTPLCLGRLGYEDCLQLGLGLARAIKAVAQPVLMVASTDMTHYESAQEAKAKDTKAIERILALDPKGLYDTVRGLGITMCGVLPTTVVLIAAKELGATQAELVAYTNSGEASGDYQQVVGYAGLIIK